MEKVFDMQSCEEILASSVPVIVDFWAPWCGPCRMLGPTISEIASEYEGKVVVAKCNVDENDDLSIRFNIRNIPALLYFKNGEMVDRSVGLVSKQEIAAKLDALCK